MVPEAIDARIDSAVFLSIFAFFAGGSVMALSMFHRCGCVSQRRSLVLSTVVGMFLAFAHPGTVFVTPRQTTCFLATGPTTYPRSSVDSYLAFISTSSRSASRSTSLDATSLSAVTAAPAAP